MAGPRNIEDPSDEDRAPKPLSGVAMRGGSINRSVSESVDYDRIIGQSLQSAIPVAVAVA